MSASQCIRFKAKKGKKKDSKLLLLFLMWSFLMKNAIIVDALMCCSIIPVTLDSAPSGLTSTTESLLSHCHSYSRGTYFWWLTDMRYKGLAISAPLRTVCKAILASQSPVGLDEALLGLHWSSASPSAQLPSPPLSVTGWPPGISKKTMWHTKLRLRVNPWVGRVETDGFLLCFYYY